MQKIYAESWALFRQGAVGFAGLAVLLETLLFFIPSTNGTSTGAIVAGILLAFFVHRHFLKGEDYFLRSVLFKKCKYVQGGIFKFGAIAFGLMVLAVILAMVFLFAVIGEGADENTVLVFVVVGASFAYWLVLGVFGTLLPAAADRDPRYRLKAGTAKTGVTMVRLLGGPGLARGAFFLALFGIAALQFAVGLESNLWFERLLGILSYFVGFYLLILTAATLCSVYREIVPAPELSAE